MSPISALSPVTLLGYPLTMVLAEKIVTAIDRGVANTRWRDFADVYTLTRLHSVDGGELRTSIETVAEYGKVTLAPLLPTLAPMNERARRSTVRGAPAPTAKANYRRRLPTYSPRSRALRIRCCPLQPQGYGIPASIPGSERSIES